MEGSTKTARPYAVAAFEQAQQEGKTAEWADMLALLTKVIADPTMAGLLSNPKVKSGQLAELIIDTCGEGLSDTGRNFVRILADNGRLGLAPEIEQTYGQERALVEKRSDVVVTSAFELSPAQQNDITVAMTKRLGTKVDLTVTVDTSLIGGVIIRAGDLVVDASVRGRLNQMAQSVA